MKQQSKKILVVEDEVKISEVVSSLLESKGFTVFCADDGKRALEIFKREQISLILLDLMLPGMSGEDICKTIRKISKVPIIMLTAKSEERNMIEGLNIGADDYITKPFSLKALYARVEAVLRRSNADLASIYQKNSFHQGDLEIDMESYLVKKKGEDVKLTPIEFRILVAFVKYPNKVFTRDELIMAAFGDEFEGYDRAVDSHIKNIRQKIEDDPKNPGYIATVHGIGYKFIGEADAS
ncbi:MAG: two component transcriptional regulator, winged helix family [Herbinix sp.]|jgi:DNA-binding response OmpR family regulator|nr:two component transcriptional regulator, winged helix family [Herbinix sp.]